LSQPHLLPAFTSVRDWPLPANPLSLLQGRQQLLP